MKEFKGTKGEWRFISDTEFPTLHQIWSKDDKSSLYNGTYIARTCYAIRSEANAKLIAAAPELLEALQRIQDKCYDITGHDIFYDIAEEAINKALGDE